VGIAAGNNGRSCCQHEVCGNHLHVGDVCRVVRCIIPSTMYRKTL
jgi:hypothetical protein